jgi:hypothetical protein
VSLLLDSEYDPGLSGDWSRRLTDGTITFGIDWQRPNSDYFTATTEGGAKHRLRGRYTSTLVPRLWLDLFTALNQYRIENVATMPLSGTLQAGLEFRLSEQLLPEYWSSRNGYLMLTYRLDSETPLAVETSAFVSPARFTRLEQTPGISTGIEQGRWRLTAYGGYQFRSDSADGTTVGGNLTFQPDERRRFYLSVDHAIDSNACAVLGIGIGLHWVI